jgi:hypothetical protein
MFVAQKMKMRVLLASFALLGMTSFASAQTTFFGDDNPRGTLTNSFAARDAFHAALALVGLDNIESYPAFTPSPTLTFTPLAITATNNTQFVADFAGQPFNYAASGTKALLDNMTAQNVFNISTNVDAFGLFIAQAGDLANVTTLSLILQNTNTQTSHTIPIGTFGPGRSDDSIFFFGVIDTTGFNQVTVFSNNLAADGILFDDVTVGFVSVPEPVSLSLLGVSASVVAAGVYYRKKRRLALDA